jgi:hypothetical protein
MGSLTFATERLPLAIYLHASQSLKLIGCESTSSGRIRFAFDDPDNKASSCELDFERGKAIPVTDIFASQKYLRRMMTQLLDERCALRHGF